MAKRKSELFGASRNSIQWYIYEPEHARDLSSPLTHMDDALTIRVTTRAWRESRGCQCFLGVDL